MSYNQRILLAGCLFALISGLCGLDVQDCGSKAGKFSKINIVGCDTSQSACILHRGTNATISIEFVSSGSATAVNTVIHGIINGIPVPFPLKNPDACSNTGINCPLKPDTTYEYQAILPVQKVYPKISLKVKWELQNQDGVDIICLLIPAKIA
ncbi:unnamed protein product [Hermetia illucens]|uniref:MD-2-related lipid-recognition domain-containing protein n=1 Tax=Hermetia illucens TaxID=343691 RepID=A0A7R8UU94_HERIL|nr:NPC intracellular cholesterol transporter 2 homolog a [Hermetia illucens]CAD7087102.1 unnamed protein product [Hermetia illucens]